LKCREYSFRGGNLRECRKLTLKAGKFKAIALSPRQNGHQLPCICYVKDAKAIAVIGGEPAKKTVELYDL